MTTGFTEELLVWTSRWLPSMFLRMISEFQHFILRSQFDHFPDSLIAARDGHCAGFLFVFPICRLLLESNELLLTFLLLSWFP